MSVARLRIPNIGTGDRMINGSALMRHIEMVEAAEVEALTTKRQEDFAAYRERLGSLTAIRAIKEFTGQLLKGKEDE